MIYENRPRVRIASVAVAAACACTVLGVSAGPAAAALPPVPLGTAAAFAVLAGTGITNTGPTVITGDIGTFPTTSETGTSSLVITGTNHAGDAVTQRAKTDLNNAYLVAAGQGPPAAIPADLAGKRLLSGVYASASSIGLSGQLTLDAAGDPNAVFVFQAGSTLTTATASSVVLVNGAQPCNVFWKIGSSATLGTGTAFQGNVLALTSITLTTGATVKGRVLARNGAVTLDTNTISRATCAPPVAKSATPTATKPAVPAAPKQVKAVPSGGVQAGDGSMADRDPAGSTAPNTVHVALVAFAALTALGLTTLVRTSLRTRR